MPLFLAGFFEIFTPLPRYFLVWLVVFVFVLLLSLFVFFFCFLLVAFFAEPLAVVGVVVCSAVCDGCDVVCFAVWCVLSAVLTGVVGVGADGVAPFFFLGAFEFFGVGGGGLPGGWLVLLAVAVVGG